MRVYAIWLPVIQGDARSKWQNTLLTDARVIHLWDEGRIVGEWFAKHAQPPYPGDLAWDAYFLYGGQAQWELAPTPLVSWGRTVLKTQKKLKADIHAVLSD